MDLRRFSAHVSSSEGRIPSQRACVYKKKKNPETSGNFHLFSRGYRNHRLSSSSSCSNSYSTFLPKNSTRLKLPRELHRQDLFNDSPPAPGPPLFTDQGLPARFLQPSALSCYILENVRILSVSGIDQRWTVKSVFTKPFRQIAIHPRVFAVWKYNENKNRKRIQWAR